MIIILIILLTLSVISIFILMKGMIDLNNHIDELERKIGALQYQTDDVLCDINIVNQNVLNTHGLLDEMKGGEK